MIHFNSRVRRDVLSIGVILALGAAALCAAAVLLLFPAPAAAQGDESAGHKAVANAPADAPTNFGALDGTIGGLPLVVRSALLSATRSGELVLSIADVPYTCADQEAQRPSAPGRAIFVFFADINGPLPLGPHWRPPTHAGPYSVIHFLDYRAAWFVERGGKAKPGVEGTRPPDGSYAAILSNTGRKANKKNVNWPISVAGTFTLDRFPERAGEYVTGSLDARFESGGSLEGTFSAEVCKKVFVALVNPGQIGQ